MIKLKFRLDEIKKAIPFFLILLWIVIYFTLSKFLMPFELFLKVANQVNIAFSPVPISQFIIFFMSLLVLLFLGYNFSLFLIKNTSLLERLILSFGLGLGVNSIIMILLGLLYNLNPQTIFVIYLVVIATLSLLNFKKFILLKKNSIHKPNKNGLIIVIAVLPFLFFSLIYVLSFPELYVDSLIYVAEYAKVIFNQKTIPFIAGGPSGIGLSFNYPPAFQMLGVFVYSFIGNENITFLRLLPLIIFIFLISLVYKWSEELFKKRSLIILSIILFISLPSLILHSRVSSIYIYLAFQFSLAFYFLQKFLIKKDKNYLFLSTIFGGFAALTSYLGLLYLFLLLFVFNLKSKYSKAFLIASILFFFIIAPWYLRNLIVLGNPVWPFGGGKYIDPIIQVDSFSQLRNVSKISGFNYDSITDLKNSLQRLFFSYINYDNASLYHSLNPIFSIFSIPAVFLLAKKREKKMNFFIIWFLFILTFYILVINYFDRYLILISVPTVFLSVYFIKELVKFKNAKWFIIFFLVTLYVYFLFISSSWNGCYWNSVTKENSTTYIQLSSDKWKQLELCYGNDAKMWKYVSENMPDVPIATYDFRLYYYNRTMVELDSWKLHELFHTTSIAKTYEILKSNNISFIIIKEDKISFSNYTHFFYLVKAVENVKLYKIK